MQAIEAIPGTIVETLIGGKPTGNIYRIGGFNGYSVYGYSRFTGHRVSLHHSMQCRDVTADYTSGLMEGFKR